VQSQSVLFSAYLVLASCPLAVWIFISHLAIQNIQNQKIKAMHKKKSAISPGKKQKVSKVFKPLPFQKVKRKPPHLHLLSCY